ncbi:MAG: energy transducer TonB [Cyanobacteria bacterium J06592_8]
MSLSETCIQQRDRDERKIKLWLIGGLTLSALIHTGLLALMFSGFLDREPEIPEEDAIEVVFLEEEPEIEPEPEEIVEEPEPIPEPEPEPEEIVEEPEPIPEPEPEPEEIVEELTPVEPTLEPEETAALEPLAPAEAESFSEPEPIAEEPLPEPEPEPEPFVEEPLPEPEPEPFVEEPLPEPEPAPDPFSEMSEEPVSEPEPLPEDFAPEPFDPPEPLADSAPPEPLASADIAPDEPLTSPFDDFEVDSGEPNSTPEPSETTNTSPFGAAAERSQPSQGYVPQPGSSTPGSSMGSSFEGIGSGESPGDGQNPGQGGLAFGGSPLQGDPGGGEPGRPGGTDEGIGNDTGDSTDTAYAGGGRLSCVDNCIPRYPRSLRNQGIEGTAIVRGLVGTDGRVAQLEIVQSSGNDDLDEAALEAASEMRFLPPDGGGSRPVRLPIQFTLN